MKKSALIILGIVLLSTFIGIYYYKQVPAMMASHWNSEGEVDSYMPKNYGLFLMPLISLMLLIIFIFIIKIDPLKKNIKKFMKYYEGLVIAIVLFLFYLHLLSIFANLGYKFNMTKMVTPSVGILFFYLGIVLENAKRNWFIGIKTPWTLSSDKVWNKTHKLGGKLFKIAGVISLLGLVFSNYVFLFIIVPVIVFVVYLIIYSYFEFAKLKKIN